MQFLLNSWQYVTKASNPVLWGKIQLSLGQGKIKKALAANKFFLTCSCSFCSSWLFLDFFGLEGPPGLERVVGSFEDVVSNPRDGVATEESSRRCPSPEKGTNGVDSGSEEGCSSSKPAGDSLIESCLSVQLSEDMATSLWSKSFGNVFAWGRGTSSALSIEPDLTVSSLHRTVAPTPSSWLDELHFFMTTLKGNTKRNKTKIIYPNRTALPILNMTTTQKKRQLDSNIPLI